MRVKVIGLGAAGNKAAICAVKNNVVRSDDVMLVNSTLKDIPSDYQNKGNCHQFIDSYGGCGKERTRSYDLCRDSLQQDIFGLSNFLCMETDDEAELVVLVTSTEGGTGSGSTPLMANYISKVFGIPVHIYAFAGFGDDVRGMRNTVEFFKDLEEGITVECVKNSGYLAQAGNNKIKAETEANVEFCKKLSVLGGLMLKDCAHNIDPTDLLNLSTTEEYMIIEYAEINQKIKNKEQFSAIVQNAIDNSKALDPDSPNQKRLGVIINIKEDNIDYIDYDVLINRFGVPYEKYTHIQHESDMPEFVAFIAAGLTLPTEEVEEVYDSYVESTKKVNKGGSAGFFESIRQKEIDKSDDVFELKDKKDTVSADDFFGTSAGPKSKNGTFGKTKVMVKVEEKTDTSEY